MTCRRCAPLLSPLRDGELDAATSREVRQHLVSCADCAAEAAALERMVAATQELAAVEPPPFLWHRIEAHLDAPPPRQPLREALRELLRPRWRLVFGGLAAAGLAGLAALVVPAAGRSPTPSDTVLLDDAAAEFRRAEEHYRRAVSDLRALTAGERASWPTARQQHFDDGLTALEQAIERSRAGALAPRGGRVDPEAEEALFVSYGREVSFLQRALLGAAAVEEAP